MRWVFAIGIPVYFWWVSLKEKDRKNPSPPTLCFIPAIVLELCVVAMLQSVERLSCLSPPCSLFFFLPFSLFFILLWGFRQAVTQEAEFGGRNGWTAELQGADAGAFQSRCGSGWSTAMCPVPVPILPPRLLPMGVPAGQKCSLMQAPVFS